MGAEVHAAVYPWIAADQGGPTVLVKIIVDPYERSAAVVRTEDAVNITDLGGQIDGRGRLAFSGLAESDAIRLLYLVECLVGGPGVFGSIKILACGDPHLALDAGHRLDGGGSEPPVGQAGQSGVGDLVEIVESRPYSKTKRWRLVKVLEKASLI